MKSFRFSVFVSSLVFLLTLSGYPQELDTLYLFPDTTTFHDPLIWTENSINAAVKFTTDLQEFSLKSILFIRPDWSPVLQGGIRISTGRIPEETVIFDTSFTIVPAYPDWNEVVFEPRVNIYSSSFYISSLPYDIYTYVHFLYDTLVMGQYTRSAIYPLNNGWIEGLPGYFAFKAVIDHKLSDLSDDALAPTECKLYDCYPNPFNPMTNIEYQLSHNSYVELKVYDILGGEKSILVSEEQPAGKYTIKFDASGFASGIYFCTMTAGNTRSTIKLLFMK